MRYSNASNCHHLQHTDETTTHSLFPNRICSDLPDLEKKWGGGTTESMAPPGTDTWREGRPSGRCCWNGSAQQGVRARTRWPRVWDESKGGNKNTIFAADVRPA